MRRNIIKIFVGLMMIITVLIGYIPQPTYLMELTCISNMLGGLLLLVDGVLGIIKREFHLNSFYLNIAVSIFVVFLVCIGSLTGTYKFNFNGAFLFLHVINPIAFLSCYMIFVNERDRNIKSIMNSSTMIMLYLLFDYIYYQFTGKFVYGFIELSNTSLIGIITGGIIIYAFMCLFSLIPFTINKFFHKK